MINIETTVQLRNKVILALMKQDRAQTRVATSSDDFGDEATVGLHLMRRKKNRDVNSDYGIFAGEVDGTWLVAIKNAVWRIEGAEAYSSLKELKEAWELD
jgi:hypothetical protein